MANPYRQSGTRVASGEPAPAPRTRTKSGAPMGPTGQPNYPVQYPPTGGTVGGPGTIIDNMNRPPVAPAAGGGRPNDPGPSNPVGGFGPGGPANVAQGGPGGSLADAIIADRLSKKQSGGKP